MEDYFNQAISSLPEDMRYRFAEAWFHGYKVSIYNARPN